MEEIYLKFQILQTALTDFGRDMEIRTTCQLLSVRHFPILPYPGSFQLLSQTIWQASQILHEAITDYGISCNLRDVGRV